MTTQLLVEAMENILRIDVLWEEEPDNNNHDSADGIPLPPVLQDLFDLEYLPVMHPPTHKESAEETVTEEEEEEEEEDDDDDEYNVDTQSQSVGTISRVPSVVEATDEDTGRTLSLLSPNTTTLQRQNTTTTTNSSSSKDSKDCKQKKKKRSKGLWRLVRRRGGGKRKGKRATMHSLSETSSSSSVSSLCTTTDCYSVQDQLLALQSEANALQRRATDLAERIAHRWMEAGGPSSPTTTLTSPSFEMESSLLEQTTREMDKVEERFEELEAAMLCAKQGNPTELFSTTTTDSSVVVVVDEAVAAAPTRLPVLDQLASVAPYMRVADLGLAQFQDKPLIAIDEDLKTVLDALMEYGMELMMVNDAATERFQPINHPTERLLSKYKNKNNNNNNSNAREKESNDKDDWPIEPWFSPPSDRDVLLWRGRLDKGYKSDLPLIKTRAIMRASPREVVDLLMDSSRVSSYNKMTQGRRDLVCLQRGADTTASESPLGIAGETMVFSSRTKPPLIRRSIEQLSVLHVRPCHHGGGGGYMSVSRSLWENDSGTQQADTTATTVRSEMLLGVNLFRPLEGGAACELTTLTHAHSSAVPDALAKKAGPAQAVNCVRDLQRVFTTTTKAKQR